MTENWLRTLTITNLSGLGPQQAVELIAQVNQPQTLHLTLRTPLPLDDRRVLDDALAWVADERSRQAGVNLLIESILIDMVVEATGQDRAAIIQRLALEIERLTPPA